MKSTTQQELMNILLTKEKLYLQKIKITLEMMAINLLEYLLLTKIEVKTDMLHGYIRKYLMSVP